MGFGRRHHGKRQLDDLVEGIYVRRQRKIRTNLRVVIPKLPYDRRTEKTRARSAGFLCVKKLTGKGIEKQKYQF